MSSYERLSINQYSRNMGKKVEEASYWNKFKAPILVKEYAAVTSISFSPVQPHTFAVTSSARVQLYSPRTHDIIRTISRFKDTAYSANFRDDGRLLVAGDATGLVQIFDVNSRAILRTLRGHDGATRVTHFFPGGKQVLSGSDDKTVKVWDVSTETTIKTYDAHSDHIRSALISPDNSNIIVSSSYDRTIKFWDTRSNGEVTQMELKQGEPVETMMFFPGSRLLVSAGGNEIKIWDILSGGKLLQTLSNHQKTITSMTFDASSTRLLTGSLDQQVKIYDTADFSVLHSLKYPGPVECVAVSPDDNHLIVGTHTGLLSMRQKFSKTELPKALENNSTPHRSSGDYRRRGLNSIPDANEVIIESRQRQRLRPYDKLLKSFKYGAALDAVLLGNHQSVIVISLLQELMLRGGLRSAIAGRDEDSLEPLLVFITKNIVRPRYTAILVDTLNITLDIYADVAIGSTVLEEAISKINHKIVQEFKVQDRIQQVLGALDMILSQ